MAVPVESERQTKICSHKAKVAAPEQGELAIIHAVRQVHWPTVQQHYPRSGTTHADGDVTEHNKRDGLGVGHRLAVASVLIFDQHFEWLQGRVCPLVELRQDIGACALEIKPLLVKAGVVGVSGANARCIGRWVAVPDTPFHATVLVLLAGNGFALGLPFTALTLACAGVIPPEIDGCWVIFALKLTSTA